MDFVNEQAPDGKNEQPAIYRVAEKVLSEQVKDSTHTTKQMSDKKESIDTGPIKEIEVPSSWVATNDHPYGRATAYGFNSPDGKTSLNVYDRGGTMDDASTKAFNKLLADNSNLARPKVLIPSQIRDLENVLGRGKLGDNQYTNSTPYPDPRAPVFHISSAQLVSVKGKTVLEVDGHYMNEDGGKTAHYRGILVPEQTSGGTKLWQLYMETRGDKDITPADHANYRKAVESVNWR